MYPGSIVTGTALKKRYDAYFAQVLGDYDYIQSQPKKKNEHAKFKILKLLPKVIHYPKLKAERFKTTVDNLVSDGYSIIQELAEEMREAHDNMPESLQGSDIGERREEAASALEQLEQPDISECANEISAVFFPSLDTRSRAKRASEAADMLSTAASAIQEFISEQEEENTQKEKEDSIDNMAELESLADQLENDVSEVENVEFPGMFG
jgi:hypothetical protein